MGRIVGKPLPKENRSGKSRESMALATADRGVSLRLQQCALASRTALKHQPRSTAKTTHTNFASIPVDCLLLVRNREPDPFVTNLLQVHRRIVGHDVEFQRRVR
jgi:hypothetical protein